MCGLFYMMRKTFGGKTNFSKSPLFDTVLEQIILAVETNIFSKFNSSFLYENVEPNLFPRSWWELCKPVSKTCSIGQHSYLAVN